MTISEKEKKICKKKFHKNTTTGKMDGTQTKINLGKCIKYVRIIS